MLAAGMVWWLMQNRSPGTTQAAAPKQRFAGPACDGYPDAFLAFDARPDRHAGTYILPVHALEDGPTTGSCTGDCSVLAGF